MFRIGIIVLITIFMMKNSYAVIYSLNESMYHRMPPLFLEDRYDTCFFDPDGNYCSAQIDLVSDTQSDLLDMIKEYSEDTTKHFNHTRLLYGICVTQTCKQYMGNTTDVRLILERCLNESMWNNYKLKTKVLNTVHCLPRDFYKDIYMSDIIVAGLLFILLILNIIGCAYDAIYVTDIKKGNRLLLSFSIKRNWSKLVSSEKPKDERIDRLKGFHGTRALSIMVVIIGHSILPFIVSVEDPLLLENAYKNLSLHIVFNGSMVVQLFFLISGCLLAFGLEVYAEKRSLNWTLIPKGILLRVLRLAPSYFVMLGIRATWFRFIGSGPFWRRGVAIEVNDCRRNYWHHLLFINNYINPSYCMIESWYIAADLQVYIIGLITIVLVKTPKARKVVLAFMFTVSLIVPAVQTYIQDLDGPVLVSPETARYIFVFDATFNHIYKTGHNNLSSFIIGIVMGFVYYKLQKQKQHFHKYKKYSFVFLCVLIVTPGTLLIAKFFYMDGHRASIFARAAYAALIKPLFCILAGIVGLGMVLKLDNTYRYFFEWRGWVPLSRISYCAFISHVFIIRIMIGSIGTTLRLSTFMMIQNCVTFIATAYLVAVPYWLLIEAPILKATKEYLLSLISKDTTEEGEETKSAETRT